MIREIQLHEGGGTGKGEVEENSGIFTTVCGLIDQIDFGACDAKEGNQARLCILVQLRWYQMNCSPP